MAGEHLQEIDERIKQLDALLREKPVLLGSEEEKQYWKDRVHERDLLLVERGTLELRPTHRKFGNETGAGHLLTTEGLTSTCRSTCHCHCFASTKIV
jgi:hypothetical protein